MTIRWLTSLFLVLAASPLASPFHDRHVVLGRHFTRTRELLATQTTLSEATTWNLRMVLRGVTTEKGRKMDEIFTVSAQFIEEQGYEPPQGFVQQVVRDNDRLKIVKSRWTLSEDPNDRKDGLWVWGLFKEPLYPFLLLQLETAPVPLAGDQDDEASSDSIKPLKLYAQIRHKRNVELGVVLEGSQLSVRQVETVKADPFGAASVDLYDNVNIGTITIQPKVAQSAT